jgi:imidazolonepropionase-like amidohydrolase
MRAAVQATSDWGTCVAAHVYTAEGKRRALAAGMRSIEHNHLLDQPTVKLIEAHG